MHSQQMCDLQCGCIANALQHRRRGISVSAECDCLLQVSGADGADKKSRSEEAPAVSGGFIFGGGALPFSFTPAASTAAEAAVPATRPGATESGKALATTDVNASTAASDAPASTRAPLPFGLAASNGPASLAFGAASQPPSLSAAISPAPFSFGALSAPPAAAAQPEALAKAPMPFQLKPSAGPFNIGKPAADAGQRESLKDSQKPPDSEPAGLDITQAEVGLLPLLLHELCPQQFQVCVHALYLETMQDYLAIQLSRRIRPMLYLHCTPKC